MCSIRGSLTQQQIVVRSSPKDDVICSSDGGALPIYSRWFSGINSSQWAYLCKFSIFSPDNKSSVEIVPKSQSKYFRNHCFENVKQIFFNVVIIAAHTLEWQRYKDTTASSSKSLSLGNWNSHTFNNCLNPSFPLIRGMFWENKK